MTSVELNRRVGYELKRVDAALRAAMDMALRPIGLTVPQYACLELIDQQPGLSNADLARGAFVTRQSMHVVLRGLRDHGLVERAETATQGRALPTKLTAEGRRRLRKARARVLEIEDRMVASLSERRIRTLLRELEAMSTALEAE